jgi:hypothetical protein
MAKLITRSGPGFKDIRPLQTAAGQATSPDFPVYDELVDRLCDPAVDPGTGEPDSVTAHTLAVLATYAYSDLDTLLEIATRLGLQHCNGLAVELANDPQFIASTAHLVQSADGRVVVLIYRGTEPTNVINWLTDIDVSPEKVRLRGPDAEPLDVHAGFYRNVRATRFKIAEALKDAAEGKPMTPAQDGHEQPALQPMEALYITGHSLGGAMAALMSILLREDIHYWNQVGHSLKALYTFGQPMVGSPDLARHYENDDVLGTRTFRYIYEGDPVPRLPSRDTGSWQHFGHEYHHTTSVQREGWHNTGSRVGQIRLVGQLLVAFGSLPLSQLIALNRLPFLYRIDDHRPNHYIARLTPEGTVSEFGDHPYNLQTPLTTRVRRETEQALRRITEVTPAVRAVTAKAMASLASADAGR